MLPLVWNKEKGVREELLRTYYYLYLDEKVFSTETISMNLINLYGA